MSFTQAERPYGIKTALGEDALMLRRFSGTERLGQLFQFELDLLSTNPEISFQSVVGTRATVRLDQFNESNRYFDGFISHFAQTSALPGRLATYRATMVPWTWFLTRSTGCRIYQ